MSKGKKSNRDAVFIRKFVALLLRPTCFHGRLYSDSAIAAGLNSVIGTSEDQDPIDTALHRRSFKTQFAEVVNTIFSNTANSWVIRRLAITCMFSFMERILEN